MLDTTYGLHNVEEKSLVKYTGFLEKISKRIYEPLKRVFDIGVSLLGIIISSPVFIIVPILIKLDSKGNVFFKHKRIGQDGRVIYVYKFRTMVSNAEDLINTFTEKQKEDPMKLYDYLESNGIINQVIANLAEEEYKKLYNYLQDIMKDSLMYNNTVSGIINNLIETLPARAEEMQKIVDNFDKEKFQNVLNFAKAANGDRPI